MRALSRLLCFRRIRNVRNLHVSCTNNTGLFRQDGNTMTVTFVTDPSVVLINRATHNGFMLSNGIFAVGPIVIFPKTVLSWNVGTFRDINEDSLVLFSTVVPKVDVVVLGIEERVNFKILKQVEEVAEKINIRAEIHYVKNAVPLYNFLATDGRFAAAALIPPLKSMEENLYIQNRIKYMGKALPPGQIKRD